MLTLEISNHGVSLFEKGDFDASLNMFQVALARVGQSEEDFFEEEDISTPPMICVAVNEFSAENMLTNVSANFGPTAAAVQDCRGIKAADFSVFRLFNRAFRLTRSHPFRTPTVVMYNMALLHHIQGMARLNFGDAADTFTGPQSSTYFLDRAERLYNAALEFVDLAADVFDVQDLMMPLFNNLGHLHALRINYRESRHYFQRLSVVLRSTPQLYHQLLLLQEYQGRSDRNSTTLASATTARSCLTGRDLHLFFSNTYLFTEPESMSAAPSA